MAHQVTIYSEWEVAQHKRNVEENGVSCGDLATYYPVEHKVGPFGGAYTEGGYLSCWFRRPRTNLCTQKEWVAMLATAVRHCKRKGSTERGLSREEMLSLMSYRPMAADLLEGKSKSTATKMKALQWRCDGIRIRYGSTDQLEGRLEGAAARDLIRALGLEEEVMKRSR